MKLLQFVFILFCLGGASAFGQTTERLRKFDLALKALKIPSEAIPQFKDLPSQQSTAQRDLLSLLPIIDPDKGLQRYLRLNQGKLSLTQDYAATSANNLVLYQTQLGDGTSTDSSDLIQRLEGYARKVKTGAALPLKGLRVAIDPGHMGSRHWDLATGKYVKIGSKFVSEGQLTLWTSFLVAQKLENLGAEVMITRTDYNPVTSSTIDNFDFIKNKAYALYKALDDWMPAYLKLSDPDLVSRIKKAPQVLSFNKPYTRQELYLQEDMEARMVKVKNYRPDIFFCFHYDSGPVDKLQSAVNDVEVYVPGAFRKNETGSMGDREMALKHLLEPRRWIQSVNLAEKVVQSVSSELKIPMMTDPSKVPTVIKVRNGVFARNLKQTKLSLDYLSVFMEGLHYDHRSEFYRLALNDRESQYHGIHFKYPSRLDALANGVQKGLIQYFMSY